MKTAMTNGPEEVTQQWYQTGVAGLVMVKTCPCDHGDSGPCGRDPDSYDVIHYPTGLALFGTTWTNPERVAAFVQRHLSSDWTVADPTADPKLSDQYHVAVHALGSDREFRHTGSRAGRPVTVLNEPATP